MLYRSLRGCYFQAARLVRYIHNVLSTYLLRCFVSLIFDDITKSMNERANADVICNVAILFREWLMKSLKSIDQHLRLCVHFIAMSGNFLEFVNAYRCQNSITIESGYWWFAPRWKLLGQSSSWKHTTSSWIASSATISTRVWRR